MACNLGKVLVRFTEMTAVLASKSCIVHLYFNNERTSTFSQKK